jgi:hypothetical protein
MGRESIGTTSPAGAQSRRSSRVASRTVEAPSARSGLPILQQSQAGAEQREVQGAAGGSRGWAAQEPPLERSAELLGVDLATIQEAATKVKSYVRADGTRIWSLMQLERQLRPEVYGQRRGYLDRRRTSATDA